MTLGADILGALPGLRAEAESMMVTVGAVTREVEVTDPITFVVSTVPTTIYAGICRLRFGGTQPGTADIPGAVVTDQSAILSFPIDGSSGISVDDVWTCTANPLDVSLVGQRLRITGTHAQTHATARRFAVEKIS